MILKREDGTISESPFRDIPSLFREGDLLVAISQSGETADTLAGLREGKRRGARTLAICKSHDLVNRQRTHLPTHLDTTRSNVRRENHVFKLAQFMIRRQRF